MNTADPRSFNPFPGLRPFRSDEDYLFFGREQQTAELLGRLREHRFIAVIGTSGSGKSSLIRAGLLPELQGGTMNRAGSAWEIAVLRPGGDPIAHLARALCEAGLYDAADEAAVPQLVATLRHSGLGLVEAVRQSRIEARANLLVVVDQFEEIFRFRDTRPANQEAADAFVKLLLEASEQRTLPIYVVLTMRSDYLGDCSQFRGLAEAVNHSEYLIPGLGRDSLRLVIEGPIRVGGGRIAFRLLQQLLNDVAHDRDQLPVLQHALMRAWEHWTRHREGDEPLDLAHYHAIGGMRGALSQHADEIHDRLPDDPLRSVARDVFKALTEFGPDNRGIRRPIRFGRLCEVVSAAPESVRTVIEAFRGSGRTFLMPPEPVEIGTETVIDISHESLMRGWQRLTHWVEEEAQSARIYRRLAESALLHRDGKAGLYRDPDLQIALSWRERAQPTEAWAERYHAGFDPAMAFLDASDEASNAEAEAREVARRRELEQAKALAEAERERATEQARFAARLKWLVRGLGLVAMIAVFAFVAALLAQRSAQRNAELASENELRARRSTAEATRQANLANERAIEVEAANRQVRGTLSRSDLFRAERHIEEDNHPVALAFLARALRNDPENSQAARRLHDLMLEYRVLIPDDDVIQLPGEIRAARFQTDGSRLVAALEDGTVVIWSPAADPAIEIVPALNWPAAGVASSADGRMILGYWSNRVEVATLAGAQPRSVPLIHPASVASAEFAPDGRTVLTGCGDGAARVWAADTGELLREFPSGGSAASMARFSPGGTLVLTIPESGTPKLWEAATGVPRGELLPVATVTAAEFSGDGRQVATGSREGIARVWTTASGQVTTVPLQHPGSVVAVRFNIEGDRLVTSDPRGTLRLWDVVTGRLLVERPWRAAADLLEVNPVTGQLFAGSTRDGLWRLWNSGTIDPLAPDVPVDGEIGAARFSPDGGAVMTASGSRLMVWPIRLGKAVQDSPFTFAGHSHGFEFGRDGSEVVGVSHEYPNWWVNRWDLADRSGSHQAVHLSSDDSIFDVRVLPGGGRVVALAGNDPNLRTRLWDAGSGASISPELVTKGAIKLYTHFDVTVDGTRMVTVTQSGSVPPRVFVELWRTEEGIAVDLPIDSAADVTAVRLSGNGDTLATVSERGDVTFWDFDTGQRRAEVLATGAPIQSLHLDSDTRRLLTVSQPPSVQVQLWETATGRRLGGLHLAGAPNWTNSVRGFILQEDKILTASFDEDVRRISLRFLDTSTWTPLAEERLEVGSGGHGLNSALGIGFAPDRNSVIDFQGRIHSIHSTTLPFAPQWLDGLAESSSGYHLTDDDRIERVPLDVRLEQRTAARDLGGEGVWNRWGRWVASDAYQRTVSPSGGKTAEAWIREMLMSGRETHRLDAGAAFPSHPEVLKLTRHPVHPEWLATLTEPRVRVLAEPGIKSTWAPDGRRFAYGLPAGQGIHVVNSMTGASKLIVQNGKDPLWSPSGDDILYVTESRHQDYQSEEVWLTDASGGAHRKLLDGTFPSWLADGKTVVAYSLREHYLVSVRLDEPEQPPRIFFRDPPTRYSAVSPDGRLIAGSQDGRFVVFDRETRAVLASLPLAGMRGILPAWAPDQTRVAFGGYNMDPGGLWIYDLAEKRAVQVALGPCTMPAWSPDGRRFSFDYRPQDTLDLRIWVVDMDGAEAGHGEDLLHGRASP